MKVWVDPPSGHRYGFPKVFDTIEDGDMLQWLYDNGYPRDADPSYIRQWSADDSTDS